MRSARNVAVIVGLLLVSACGGSASPSTGPSASLGPAGPVTVDLGLYSGRPDPAWTLTADEAVALDKALAALPEDTSTPPVGGLGYHGFTILLPGRTLVAYRGVVTPPGDGPHTVKADPTRGIERFLLETSRPHVTADEYAEVERALAGP